jgi:ribonucleoside-diphosphate reductase beta chain
MNGMGQIVTWSIRDETLHVESMIQLFRVFIEENPRVWTKKFQQELYDIAKTMVDLEDGFIDLAFEMGGIQGLTADEVKTYIRYIADRRLIQLGLKGLYNQRENPLDWMEFLLQAPEHTNFFENQPTAYSKGALQGSWGDIWGKYREM